MKRRVEGEKYWRNEMKNRRIRKKNVGMGKK